MSEDVLTSFYLAAAGWQIVYVQEDVQWGLVPSTMTAQLKQAKRWCAGIISAGAVFYSPRAQNVILREKYGVLFPLLLFSSEPLVAYTNESQLRVISVLFLIRFLAILSHDMLATKAASYHLSLLLNAGTWAVPFQFMTIVQRAISISSGREMALFTPSGLTGSHTPKSFASRIKTALWADGFIVHVLVAMSLVRGVVLSVNGAVQLNDDGGFWKEVLIRAGWPPIFQIWSAYLIDCWTPISYTLFPPTPLSRESLIDRDPMTQLAYPNRYAKDQVRIRPRQISAILRILYCIGVCVTAISTL